MTGKPTLSRFILENIEPILNGWESFARGLAGGDEMDVAALRDHAKDMLLVIAADLEQPQSRSDQADKAQGRSDAAEHTPATAAQEHGAGRADSGFTVEEMVAEFRALRASVIRLWARTEQHAGSADLDDMTRFNEAIDQAIAESIARYTTQVSQSKERFLAILGHDLRTPLGAIITSTQFMLDTDGLSEPYLTLVSGIGSSARRMNQMVADLLDYTRTRFGDDMGVDRVDMDVAAMVHSVVAEITAVYPASTIKVKTSGDLRGQWDLARLTQAVTNLVGNAVHHGSDTETITVSARGEPDEVVIAVHNRGRPIPEREFGRIFEAMGKGDTTGKRDRRHLGLGLYIVDKIVKAHKGSIDVASSGADGTTFTVHLPRA